jgi:serine-type D-Ala-D-Ala carboxypeptidase/endopeptidase
MGAAMLPALFVSSLRTLWVSAALGGALLGTSPARCADSAAPATDWAAVDTAVQQAHRQAGGDFGMAVHIHDRLDRLVYTRTLGGYRAEQPVPVASASKLVAGLLILSLVERGALSLDATTQQVLGWEGERGRISLRQLLAQVSGLQPNARCMEDTLSTLAACVDAIRDSADPPAHPAGSYFDYGGSHFQVAARMAEVATGLSWQALFTQHLGEPLALAARTNFYTAPWLGEAQAGNRNPRVAAGLWVSLNDYSKLMAVVFHKGVVGGRVFARPALFDEMGTEPHPQARVGTSPMALATQLPMRYGLGAWLECVPARVPCPVLSSAGAFGWTPWLDREAGYYAVIAMLRFPTGGVAGSRAVVAFSVQLQQQLKPLVARAVARAVAGAVADAKP